MAGAHRSDGELVLERKPRTRSRHRRPPLYRVLMHNDDYTTQQFVVEVLQSIFHKPRPEAVRIMLHVHHHGIGVAGVYTREVAETKVVQTERLARAHGYPLRLSLEPVRQDDAEGEDR